MAKKKRKLTLKQLSFFKYLIKTGDKRKAAKKAYNIGGRGGSKTKKQQNNTADKIAQYVTANLQDLLDKHYEKQKLNIEWVLKRLAFKADNSFNEVVQVKCIEDIGKFLKMFSDKTDIPTYRKISDISKDELADMAEKARLERIDRAKKIEQGVPEGKEVKETDDSENKNNI